MIFRIGKVWIRIRSGFLFVVAAFLLLDYHQISAMICSAVVLHELGHLIALHLLGIGICEIECSFSAISVTPGRPVDILWEKLLVNAAGVLSNIFCAALFYLLEGEWMTFFSAINFALAVVQMLPLPGLDGGSLLESLLGALFESRRAERYLCVLERFFAISGLLWAARILICSEEKAVAGAALLFFGSIFFSGFG